MKKIINVSIIMLKCQIRSNQVYIKSGQVKSVNPFFLEIRSRNFQIVCFIHDFTQNEHIVRERQSKLL